MLLANGIVEARELIDYELLYILSLERNKGSKGKQDADIGGREPSQGERPD